jgi:hypothetical protein
MEGANLIPDQNLLDSNCKNVNTIKALHQAQRFSSQFLDPRAAFIDFNLHSSPTDIFLSIAQKVSFLPRILPEGY